MSPLGPGRSAEGAQDVFERGGEQLLGCLAGGLTAQPASRRGAVEPGPGFKGVAQPEKVMASVNEAQREYEREYGREIPDAAETAPRLAECALASR